MTIICTLDGCGLKAHARGYCNRHYKRWQVTGDPLRNPTNTSYDVRERLALKTRLSETGCIEWTGNLTTAGYGQTTVKSVRAYVHRLAWELFVGKIPDGLWVLHHCDNPKCCNVMHLFLGTPKDNTRDGMRKGRITQVRGRFSMRKAMA